MHFRVLTYTRLKTAETIVLCLLLISIISFTSVPLPHADAGTISLNFKKEGISAIIENASLKAVVKKIAKKEDIWIKGTKKLSDEIYSVEFEGESVREALKRILSSFNYCLFLGPQGKVLGVIIVSKRGRKSIPNKRSIRRRAPRRIRRREGDILRKGRHLTQTSDEGGA